MSQSIIKNDHSRFFRETYGLRWFRMGFQNYGRTLTLYTNHDGNGNGIIMASKSFWAMNYRAPNEQVTLNKLNGDNDTTITLTATITTAGVLTITSSSDCTMTAFYLSNDSAAN